MFVLCFSDKPSKPACIPHMRKEKCVCGSSHTESVCPQQGEPRALFQSGLIRSDVRLRAPRLSLALGVSARR